MDGNPPQREDRAPPEAESAGEAETPPEGRDKTADLRDRQADDRDRLAEHRDRTAAERDRVADESDVRSERFEAQATAYEKGPERRSGGAGRRTVDTHAAGDRLRAASDRDAASGSRRGGARDRMRALIDREAASADRDVAAQDRDVSTIDELTGAYRRGPGLVELEREMSRAQRTGSPFVLAFVDVDGLKARNDSLGHAAGDELLLSVVEALRGRLRSYDLIVRFGGDEFVCAVLDLNLTETLKRFVLVDEDLAKRDATLTVGFAELADDDSLSDLMARADEELYSKRSLRRSTRS